MSVKYYINLEEIRNKLSKIFRLRDIRTETNFLKDYTEFRIYFENCKNVGCMVDNKTIV
jgi:hypothetical protein